MKTKNVLFSLFIAMMLTSCVTTSYFQVYKAKPSDKLVAKDNLLVYEDENCKVSYNLWEDGGNMGFQFFNKTDKNIYLNLEESFFILNGISHNYYKNRVYTHSTSSGAAGARSVGVSKSISGVNYIDMLQTNRISATNTISVMTSAGYSVSFNEEKTVCVPSKTSKVISEYKINETLFRDCDLYRYPKKKQVKSKFFTKEQSPFVFSNRITYTIGQVDSHISFENEFYVSEISNLPESEMVVLKLNEFCGQKGTSKSKYFKDDSADKFFIEYRMNQKDLWKH